MSKNACPEQGRMGAHPVKRGCDRFNKNKLKKTAGVSRPSSRDVIAIK